MGWEKILDNVPLKGKGQSLLGFGKQDPWEMLRPLRKKERGVSHEVREKQDVM